jgi:haloalkane dehalogenase
MNQQHIDVGPSKLGYTRSGRGPDLVFVHGWPLHGATFRHIVPRLSEHFTCHVFDLPGAGKSEWTAATQFTLPAHAAALVTAIDRLKLERVGFVAHDSGGTIARIAAAQLGDRCFGIVSGNTEIAGYRPPMLKTLVALRDVPFGAQMFAASARVRAIRRSSLGFGGTFDDLDRLDGEFGALFLDPLSEPAVLEGQWGLVRDFDWRAIDELEAVHRRITAPVLFVCGKDDPWFPLEVLRPTLGQLGGGARIEVMPGKLFVHEEHPEAFADHAERFLVAALGAVPPSEAAYARG